MTTPKKSFIRSLYLHRRTLLLVEGELTQNTAAEVVREEEIIKTEISVEEALRVVVSAGRVPLETSALVNQKDKPEEGESNKE